MKNIVLNSMKFVAKQLNAIFPFLYELRYILKIRSIQGIFFFGKDLFKYKKLETPEFPLSIKNLWPFYYDRFVTAGTLQRHYFYQDIWAAKRIKISGVEMHYDIGSRLDGFVAHCLIFTKVTMLDIRPLPYKIDNLKFIQVDAMDMSNIPDDSIQSLSSLHAVEHFGLGRYGDPVDPDGYKKVIKEMQRVVRTKGKIYFSVPIGMQRVEFNGHRIFDPEYVVELFDECRLIEFSAESDEKEFITGADFNQFRNSKFSCGMFLFKKIAKN